MISNASFKASWRFRCRFSFFDHLCSWPSSYHWRRCDDRWYLHYLEFVKDARMIDDIQKDKMYVGTARTNWSQPPHEFRMWCTPKSLQHLHALNTTQAQYLRSSHLLYIYCTTLGICHSCPPTFQQEPVMCVSLVSTCLTCFRCSL